MQKCACVLQRQLTVCFEPLDGARPKMPMHHHQIRVRPERKKRPLHSRHVAPPHPSRCKVGYQQSRSGERFPVAKKSFHSCSRKVCHRNQHCKGGAAWSQPRSESGKCRGDVFSLGTGRDSILTTPAYASERKIHVPWKHGPFVFVSVSGKQGITRPHRRA